MEPVTVQMMCMAVAPFFWVTKLTYSSECLRDGVPREANDSSLDEAGEATDDTSGTSAYTPRSESPNEGAQPATYDTAGNTARKAN
jgi:hypothetical protein